MNLLKFLKNAFHLSPALLFIIYVSLISLLYKCLIMNNLDPIQVQYFIKVLKGTGATYTHAWNSKIVNHLSTFAHL